MLERGLSIELFITLSKSTKTVTDLIKEDIQQYGLIASEFSVLEYLYFEGEQPIQVIGSKVILTSGSMTYIINKLEDKKLIKRRQCKKDKRIYYIRITKKGIKLFEEVFPTHKKYIEKVFSGLNKNEKKQMIELFQKMHDYAKTLKEE